MLLVSLSLTGSHCVFAVAMSLLFHRFELGLVGRDRSEADWRQAHRILERALRTASRRRGIPTVHEMDSLSLVLARRRKCEQ
jgi:hypothetical protein